MSVATNQSNTSTSKAIGGTIIGVSIAVFLCSVLPFLRQTVGYFFLGLVGYSLYPLCLFGVFLGVILCSNKVYNFDKKYATYLGFALFFFFALLHTILSTYILNTCEGIAQLPNYISCLYDSANYPSVGGCILGLFVYLVFSLLGVAGSYVAWGIATCIFVGLAIDAGITQNQYKKKIMFTSKVKDEHVDTTSNYYPTNAVRETLEPENYSSAFYTNQTTNVEEASTTITEEPATNSSAPSTQTTTSNATAQKLQASPHTQELWAKIEENAQQIRTQNANQANNTLSSEQTYDPAKFKSKRDYILQPKLPNLYVNKKQAQEQPTAVDAFVEPEETNQPFTTQTQNTTFTQEQTSAREIARNRLFSATDTPAFLQEETRNTTNLQNMQALQSFANSEDDEEGEEISFDTFPTRSSMQPNSTQPTEPTTPERIRNRATMPNMQQNRFAQAEESNTSRFAQSNNTQNTTRANNISFTENTSWQNQEPSYPYNEEESLPLRPNKTGRGPDLAPRKPRETYRSPNNTGLFDNPLQNLSAQKQEEKQLQMAGTYTPPTRSVFDQRPATSSKPYTPPPTSLIKTQSDDPSKYGGNTTEKSRIIETVLNNFKIPAKVINVVAGPSVTRYELAMPRGIPVRKVLTYESDIFMALCAKNGIRIEAPIPGKNAFGIEVPNDARAMVSLREILESKEFQTTSAPLPVAIGKNISGEIVVKSMAKMLHCLVAGSTGSGKSVFLHNLIVSLMYKCSPEELRFIMVDPKRVEFNIYNGMPHLMLPNTVYEIEKVVNALTWAVKEMNRRYDMFKHYEVRDIISYNNCDAVQSGQANKVPYIVIIVDELNELMMSSARREIEDRIKSIAQLGRASGIHLVLATQRPSVEVITGTIKANLPTRIAFALTNAVDSRTILDESGAEKLLGHGDMLFSPQDSNIPIRLQAAFVEMSEIKQIVEYLKAQYPSSYDAEVEKEIYAEKQPEPSASTEEDHGDSYDELLPQALKLCIESNAASISMVQRRFYVGYARAARIIDQMEQRGYISPANGSKTREVYMTMDEYNSTFGEDA